jgi:hypothetical protein
MTNAPAPNECRGDRRRRGVGEWGRPVLDKCGIEQPDAFANGFAQDRRAVGLSTTQWTPICVRLAIITQEQNGRLRSPIVSAGARYASAKQTRAALRRHQGVSGTGRGPDDVAEPGHRG